MTKKTVAKTRAPSKSRTEKPVDAEIRRAAKRAGITDRTGAPAPSHLTPEDEAILARRNVETVGPRSGRVLVEMLRSKGLDNEQIAFVMRDEARRLELLADEYRPAAKGEALAAALDVIAFAEQAFESSGLAEQNPEQFLLDALACAQDDIEAVANLAAEGPPMLGRRAELRVDLALKLYEFRKAHGYPKAASEQQQAEGGAS